MLKKRFWEEDIYVSAFILPLLLTSGVEAAAELPAGGAEEKGESLVLHTKPPAPTDRLPQTREQFTAWWGAWPPPNVFSGYTHVALKCTVYLDCKEWVKAENWTLRLPVCLWIEDPRAREAPSECLEEKPCGCWEGKSQNVWEQYATCDQRS